MKRYHLAVLGYYNNHDTTRQVSIDCDGVAYSHSGCYEFWIMVEGTREAVAYYPIRNTIISKIEDL